MVTPLQADSPLMGTAEIAALAGVSKQCVSNWVRRYANFPKPIAELAMGNVWARRDVIHWLRSRGISSEQTK